MSRLAPKLLAFIVACGAVYAAVVAVLSWQVEQRIENKLEALRAAGVPVTLADLHESPPAPDRNAAELLSRADKDLAAVSRRLQPLFEPSSENLYGPDGTLNEAGQRLVKSALEGRTELLSLIEQAAASPEYHSAHDYSLPAAQFIQDFVPRMERLRQVSRVLYARNQLLLAEGKAEEAMRTCLLMLRLGQHFAKEPLTVGYLAALDARGWAHAACTRTLAAGSLSDELRQELDGALDLGDGKALVHAIETERAYNVSAWHDSPDWNASRLDWRMKREQYRYLQWLDLQLQLGAKPYYRIASEMAKLDSAASDLPWLFGMAVPALQAVREVDQRIRAQAQCLHVLNALQRYLQSGTDQSSVQLAELKLNDEFTTDPYTGQPLMVQRETNGWVVYTTGPDLEDDGGQLDRYEDVGVRTY